MEMVLIMIQYTSKLLCVGFSVDNRERPNKNSKADRVAMIYSEIHSTNAAYFFHLVGCSGRASDEGGWRMVFWFCILLKCLWLI